jgi:Tol biopolymer transport system component
MQPPPPPRDETRWSSDLEPPPSLLFRTVVSFIVACAFLATAFPTYRSLLPFPPRAALPILFLAGLWVTSIAVAASGMAPGPGRRTALILLLALAPAIPPGLARWVPGVALPREYAIPGSPNLVSAAAPWGRSDLYLIPDGQPDRTFPLTRTPDVDERFPQLAPDGHRIVYAIAGSDGNYDLYLMDLDDDLRPAGTRLLLDGPGSLSDSCWSPDGRRLLIRSEAEGSEPTIFELDVRTGALRPFLRNAINPQWSPDGRRLLYVSFQADDPSDADIFSADGEGRHRRLLIDTGYDDFFPAYSPDGRWIAFTSEGAEGDDDVFVARVDGTGVRNLTPDSSADDASEDWTPRGQILFLSDRSGTGGTFLYFMERDGSNVRLAKML